MKPHAPPMHHSPPEPRRDPVETTLHGVTRADPYGWMRDDNWQQVMRQPDVLRADVRAHLEAENAYTDAVLAHSQPAQVALFAEMKARIKAEDSSVPSPDGAFAYYQRFEEASQHPIHCRRPAGPDGPEQVLLDGNHEAAGKPFFRVAAAEHSPDHRRFAFAVDTQGSERHTLVVRDVESGAVLDDAVQGAGGTIVWANDSASFLYIVLDENLRPSRICRHFVGASPKDDELVYEEPDAGFYLSVGKSDSRRFFVLNAHDHQTSELRLVPADPGGGPPRLMLAREPGVEMDVAHNGDRLYFLTNAGGAEDFRIVRAPLADPSPDNWQDFVPHRPGTLILGMRMFRNHLVWLEREEGLPRIVVRRLSDGATHAVAFDEEAYDLSVVPGFEFDTTTLRFVYSSLSTPNEIYDYDLETRTRTLRKRQEIPSGHDPSRYRVHRLLAPAADGERVPVSLVHAADTPLDGTAPLLLYGYGAYGLSMPASFSPNRFSLIDRGFVYAIAHVRGGTERGYRWYRTGRMADKPNTFTDFVAAAEHLAEQGYSAPGRIAIFGGSAGGLLVGAALNLCPELFGAAVAEVPFVDVLNTMCDATLPLTPPEWTEWGNPVVDESAFRCILGYSPYDNVREAPYPPVLATAGLSDPRVTYWEPAKWVARLRDRTTGDAPILLKTNLEAGHGGASGRFAKLAEIALIYAFLLDTLGRLDPAWTEQPR